MNFRFNCMVMSSATLSMAILTLTGCQSLHTKPAPVTISPTATPTVQPSIPSNTTAVDTSNNTPASAPVAAMNTNTVSTPNLQFSINGKIGITTSKQAGSAFYVWTQQGQNFAIDLAGALNAGQTKINYNGQSATLVNDKGEINAASPEELLFSATGWLAPISQLSYWIQGQSAPSDSNAQQDGYNRLVKAQNGDWSAEFSYANNSDALPNRLTARHPDGYKVVMTINRLK